MSKQQEIVDGMVKLLTYSMFGSRDIPDGMFFSFENNITDTGEGGYYGGYYWRKFDFGQFGTVWLSCWDKDDLVNYYK